MTKQSQLFPLRFFLITLLLLLLTLLFSLLAVRFEKSAEPTAAEGQALFSTVILDAGHGGEDGGAVSSRGYFEKDLNLALCRQMEVLLKANGVDTVMTRREDILLYDKSADYQGRKKALDLLARRRIGEETADSLFVSIHMNSYPIAKYHGLQVWYSPNNEGSLEVADRIQSTVAKNLQPENDRQIKAAGSNIYLLHHLSSPAVLVECGFLSNPEEAERLNDPAYQKQLAFLITLSILQSNFSSQK